MHSHDNLIPSPCTLSSKGSYATISSKDSYATLSSGCIYTGRSSETDSTESLICRSCVHTQC